MATVRSGIAKISGTDVTKNDVYRLFAAYNRLNPDHQQTYNYWVPPYSNLIQLRRIIGDIDADEVINWLISSVPREWGQGIWDKMQEEKEAQILPFGFLSDTLRQSPEKYNQVKQILNQIIAQLPKEESSADLYYSLVPFIMDLAQGVNAQDAPKAFGKLQQALAAF